VQGIPGGKRGKEGENEMDRICVPYLSLALSQPQLSRPFCRLKIKTSSHTRPPSLYLSRALSRCPPLRFHCEREW